MLSREERTFMGLISVLKNELVFLFFFFFLDSMTGRQLTEKMEDDVGRKF